MNARTLRTVVMATLLLTAGAVSGVSAATTTSADTDGDGTDDVSVSAEYDDGTVALTVTENGTGIEGVAVTADGESVGETDANGTAAFETNATEELELTLTKDGVTVERTYAIENGTLVESEDEELQGPPVAMPDAAADHVTEIHEVIRSYLDGELNGSLGDHVSAVASENGQDNRPDHAGNASSEGEKPDDPGSEGEDNRPDDAGNGNGSDGADDEDDEDDEE